MLHHTTTVEGTTAIVAVHTDIDYDMCAELQSTTAGLPPAVTQISLRMDDVSFMDISGLHLLEGLRSRTRALDGRLVVDGMGRQPVSLLRHAAAAFPGHGWEEFLRAG
ncbi:STAS domain-containing protein [Streptomyces sp. NPDC048650]|uniref:STAS domain-containing protein n=1 Tax=unclassified Streptomyces TaxID=2593676 RepID=UPI003710E7AE